MNSMIALILIPFPLGWEKTIGILWLETSTGNKLATVGSVRLVRVILPGKYLLNIMIPCIIGAFNPDSFRLVYCWYRHRFLLYDSLCNGFSHYSHTMVSKHFSCHSR
jgi:hypothetical protein